MKNCSFKPVIFDVICVTRTAILGSLDYFFYIAFLRNFFYHYWKGFVLGVQYSSLLDSDNHSTVFTGYWLYFYSILWQSCFSQVHFIFLQFLSFIPQDYRWYFIYFLFFWRRRVYFSQSFVFGFVVSLLRVSIVFSGLIGRCLTFQTGLLFSSFLLVFYREYFFSFLLFGLFRCSDLLADLITVRFTWTV